MKSPGTKLYYSDTGVDPYAQASRVMEIMPPPLKWDDVDETHLESADAIKEWSAGWGDSGEPKFRLKFTGAQFAIFLAKAVARASYYWRIVFPQEAGLTSPDQMNWYGHIKAIDFDSIQRGKNDVLSVEVTMKASGPITFTQAT